MQRREFAARDGTKLVFALSPVQNSAGEAAVPLVCVCGLSSVKEDWFGVIALLGGERSVAVLDNRGIGESYETSRGPFSHADQANDIIDMMDHLGWATAILWGHSMGGMIAQRVTLENPLRVSRLILLGTTASLRNPARPAKVDLAHALVANMGKPRAEVERLMWLYNTTQQFVDSNPAKVEHLVATLGSYRRPVKGIAAQAQAVSGFDVAAEVGRIACPTLIVHGTDDLLIDIECGRDLARRIPNATLHVMAAGHSPQFQYQTEELVFVVQHWLASQARSRAKL